MHTHCEIITTAKIINVSVTAHSYLEGVNILFTQHKSNTTFFNSQAAEQHGLEGCFSNFHAHGDLVKMQTLIPEL